MKTTESGNSKQPNPFGPVVGTVIGAHPAEQASLKSGEGRTVAGGRGTLYVTTGALCFLSRNFLGMETCRLILPWKIILDVSIGAADKGGLESRLVTVTVGTKERLLKRADDDNDDAVLDKVYQFRILEDGDEAFGMIADAHTKFGCVDPKKENASPQDKKGDCPGNGDHEHTNAHVQFRTPLHRSISDPIGAITPAAAGLEGHETEEDYKAACAIAAMSEFRNLSVVMKSKRKLLAGVDECEESSTSESSPPQQKKGQAAAAPSDMSLAWRELRDSEEPSFKEVSCQNLELSCDLDTFFDMFLCDDAPHSMPNYQRDIAGDSDFHTSSWKMSGDGFSLAREIKYTHPVNAPMAPPSAQATKKQKLRRFGEHGICLDTQTIVDDVPMTDCFVVDDRMLVEPRPEGGLTLRICFEIRFIKRTMFERIITNTTRGEFMKFGECYAKWVRNMIDGEAGGEVVAAAAAQPKVIVQTQPLSPEVKWTLIFFGLFLLASQALVLFEIHSLQRTVSLLEEHLEQKSMMESDSFVLEARESEETPKFPVPLN